VNTAGATIRLAHGLHNRNGPNQKQPFPYRCAVLCCAVLCCAVLCCAVLCCAELPKPAISNDRGIIMASSNTVQGTMLQQCDRVWRCGHSPQNRHQKRS